MPNQYHDQDDDQKELMGVISNTFENEGDDGEAWLVSYADMMTLIACFFILMTAFATYETPKFAVVAKEIKEHFKGSADTDVNIDLQELVAKLYELVKDKEVFKMKVQDNGVEIKFNSAYLFESGDARLKPEMEDLLSVMVDVIKKINADYIIETHGHTDSRPLRGGRFQDNWELSAARAISVIRKFQEKGFQMDQLMAIGHGESKPEIEEKDKSGSYIAENMALNRRVILLVKKKPENLKLGLGHLYREDTKVKK